MSDNFAAFLKESALGLTDQTLAEKQQLNERFDSRQVSTLVGMVNDAFGPYNKRDEDDVTEFIMSMGEDISGFGTKEFNQVMKAYKSGLNESTDLCEACGQKHLDEACDELNEASMAHGRVSKQIAAALKASKTKHKVEFDGDYDSFYRINNEEVSIVVDDDSVMVSSEDGDYREFKHKQVDAAIEFAMEISL